ncbi:hypothetical protein [Hymenobacter metallicola]|uniref:DUF4468 domain-containing protein n=1 Tax=Hymenobacter metallicola TaxID=2563114 RepID=A0A4Z0QL02_9BACT|nr:hypothetical protein [Hymenobacter metallicola]TGE29412.1 hypothetical protein E5K02_08155 [Hymenobacter metallicola]
MADCLTPHRPPPTREPDGSVLATGTFRLLTSGGSLSTTTVWFTCLVETKDGRARYTFTDFRQHEDYTSSVAATTILSKERYLEPRPIEEMLLPNPTRNDFDGKGRPRPATQQVASLMHEQISRQIQAFLNVLAAEPAKAW